MQVKSILNKRTMKTLTKDGKTIHYSEAFFTEESIISLIDSKITKETINYEEVLLEEVVTEVYNQIIEDEIYKKEDKEHSLHIGDLVSDLRTRINSPITEINDADLSNQIKTEYLVLEEGESYSHYFDKQLILTIHKDEKELNASSEKKILWACVVIDALMIIAAAIDIKISGKNKTKGIQVVLKETNVVSEFIEMNIREISILLENGEDTRAIVKLAEVIKHCYGYSSLKNITAALIICKHWWQTAALVVEFIAGIFAIVLSGGAALAAKIVLLVDSIVILGIDIKKLKDAK